MRSLHETRVRITRSIAGREALLGHDPTIFWARVAIGSRSYHLLGMSYYWAMMQPGTSKRSKIRRPVMKLSFRAIACGRKSPSEPNLPSNLLLGAAKLHPRFRSTKPVLSALVIP